uniref:Uncharacterized protein n=1 Tax=Anguilla anguilla TaxID=7936 RepID=A0A0E9X1J3_ANGAN
MLVGRYLRCSLIQAVSDWGLSSVISGSGLRLVSSSNVTLLCVCVSLSLSVPLPPPPSSPLPLRDMAHVSVPCPRWGPLCRSPSTITWRLSAPNCTTEPESKRQRGKTGCPGCLRRW